MCHKVLQVAQICQGCPGTISGYLGNLGKAVTRPDQGGHTLLHMSHSMQVQCRIVHGNVQRLSAAPAKGAARG